MCSNEHGLASKFTCVYNRLEIRHRRWSASYLGSKCLPPLLTSHDHVSPGQRNGQRSDLNVVHIQYMQIIYVNYSLMNNLPKLFKGQ